MFHGMTTVNHEGATCPMWLRLPLGLAWVHAIANTPRHVVQEKCVVTHVHDLAVHGRA
jgi:hypothetical protein